VLKKRRKSKSENSSLTLASYCYFATDYYSPLKEKKRKKNSDYAPVIPGVKNSYSN